MPKGTMIENVRDLVTLHEGVRRFPYTDTVGKLTVGIGFNLTDVGLLPEEMEFILDNRLRLAEREFAAVYPWYNELDDVRKAVLLDMTYNMGLRVLSQFVNTLAMIRQGRYADAATNMLKSKWARQVGKRAQRLARMMETGQWPEI